MRHVGVVSSPRSHARRSRHISPPRRLPFRWGSLRSRMGLPTTSRSGWTSSCPPRSCAAAVARPKCSSSTRDRSTRRRARRSPSHICHVHRAWGARRRAASRRCVPATSPHSTWCPSADPPPHTASVQVTPGDGSSTDPRSTARGRGLASHPGCTLTARCSRSHAATPA